MTLADLPRDIGTLIQDYAALIFAVNSLRYLLVAAAMAGIVAIMVWRNTPRRIQARRARPADYRREMLTSLRTVAVFSVVAILVVWAQRNGWMAPIVADPAGWQIVVAVVALLIWHDTWFYWTHRAMHSRRVFPWMHRTHHRSVTPTPFAAYAFSTSEAVVQAAFLPLWLTVVPTPLGATFIVLAIMIVRNVMGHAGVELHPRGWADHPVLQWVITTVHHDLHHSGGFATNYGLYFTWWDRLCGTEHRDYRARFRELTERSTIDGVGLDQAAVARVGQH